MRLVFALLSLALATPALAQTATPVLTVGAPLVDGSPGDGRIVLSTKRSAAFPAKTAINDQPCPVTSVTPAYSYTKFGVACPTPAPVIEPPVVTPPPPVEPPVVPPVITPPAVDGITALLAPGLSSTGAKVGAEFFSRSDVAGVQFGFNEAGGLGSVRSAPGGFQGYAASGNRIGVFHVGRGVEGVMHGRVVAGFRIGYSVGGKRVVRTNQRLSGLHDAPGVFTSDGTWIGRTADGLSIRQSVTQAGGDLAVNVTLTNVSGATMTGLRYQYQIDPDMDDDAPIGWKGTYDRDKIAFPVAAKVTAPGTLTMGFLGAGAGLSTYLHTTDPRARVSFLGTSTALGDLYAPAAFSTPQAVGYSRTADALGNLTFELGLLAVGESTSLSFHAGLTEQPALVGAAR